MYAAFYHDKVAKFLKICLSGRYDISLSMLTFIGIMLPDVLASVVALMSRSYLPHASVHHAPRAL